MQFYIYEAIKKLSDKKLVTNVITKYTDEAGAGIVYMQSPNQGSVVKRGRVVVLNVSLGPIKSELPDFVKSDLFDVEDYLNKEFPSGGISFKIEDPVYEFNEEVEKGKILDQEPKSGLPISVVNSYCSNDNPTSNASNSFSIIPCNSFSEDGL